MDDLNVQVIVLIDNKWYNLKLNKLNVIETPEGLKFEIEGTEKDSGQMAEADSTKEV